MFQPNEMVMLQDALDMIINSNKRAKNSKTNPMFTPIYDKLISDASELKLKLTAIHAEHADKPRK